MNNDNTYTKCTSCGRPTVYCKGGCGCNNSNCGCKKNFCCGSIQQKASASCPDGAVIPSVTVDRIDQIKGIYGSFVHVAEDNTTLYIDENGSAIITWAGPINVPNYDFEANPSNYRDRIVTDTDNGRAAIYDRDGRGYQFAIVDDSSIEQAIQDKIEEMVRDGSIGRLISEQVKPYVDERDSEVLAEAKEYIDREMEEEHKHLEFYSIDKSAATYLLKFPNGKWMVVDTGTAGQWSDIRRAMDSLDISEIDYLILTHSHPDHIGNLGNMIDSYASDECQIFVGMKPDYTRQIAGSETGYDNMISAITSRGYTPVVPVHDSKIEVDEGVFARFLNTDPVIADSYYGRFKEYSEGRFLDENCFSLVTEIEYRGHYILLTGDIEKAAEEKMAPLVHKAAIITAPHHGVNQTCAKNFYEAVSPEVSVVEFVVSSTQSVQSVFAVDNHEQYRILENVSDRVVTNGISTPDENGLFAFAISNDGLEMKTPGESLYIPRNQQSYRYTNIVSVIDNSVLNASDASIGDVVRALPYGGSLAIYMWNDYKTSLKTLYDELVSLFPYLNDRSFGVEILKNSNNYATVKCYFSSVTFESYSTAEFSNLTIESFRGNRTANGTLTSYDGEESFIEMLKTLPRGTYTAMYKHDNTSDPIVTDGYYNVCINVMQDFYVSNRLTATITGVLRNTDNIDNPNYTKGAFIGFVDTNSTNNQFGIRLI